MLHGNWGWVCDVFVWYLLSIVKFDFIPKKITCLSDQYGILPIIITDIPIMTKYGAYYYIYLLVSDSFNEDVCFLNDCSKCSDGK